MKRFVVIGLGRFGSWVARSLHHRGFDVVAFELDEELVDRYADRVTRAVAADGTDPAVLEAAGARGADAAVVSTGADLAATIMATLALREVGVEQIYAKVSSTRAADAMARFDITEAVFPEREMADRLAHRLASNAVLDYVRLAEGYSIQEMAVPDAWVGRTLRELSLPAGRAVSVVALYDVLKDEWSVVPDPDRALTESDVAIVAGKDETLARLTREVDPESRG